MRKYWVISDRNQNDADSSRNPGGPIYFVSDCLEHFFKRRLGRSGLDPTAGNGHPADAGQRLGHRRFRLFAKHERDIHGAYFKMNQYAPVGKLMREIVRGIDRGVLVTQQIASANSW